MGFLDNSLFAVGWTTFVICVLLSRSNAFTPPTASTSRAFARLPGPIFSAPVETKENEGMTTEDYEVLFGEAPPSSPFERSEQRTTDRFGNVLPDPSSKTNTLDHAKDPLMNKLGTMRSLLQSCPEMWLRLAQHCPDKRALLDEKLCDEKIDVTFQEMNTLVHKSATVFRKLGIKKGDNVAILAENSARWLMVDHGIQMVGGASAVRGADAPLDELRYIYEHSDSARVAVLQGPRLLQKLIDSARIKGLPSLGLLNAKHGQVKTIVLLNREKKTNEQIQELSRRAGVRVVIFAELLKEAEPMDPNIRPTLKKDDIATIVYTSGTTGRPKGVVLSHGNLLHQIGHRLGPTRPVEESEPLPGEVMVSLLPVWHITERSFELWIASRGCSVVYSSIRTFKNDLAKHRPQWMVLVPRVLEKVAMGVQDKFASGSLPVRVLSSFFTKVGNVSNKYKKIAHGLVVGEEKPGTLARLASKLVVVAVSPLNAVGNKLVWSKVQDGFGGRLKLIISGGSALAGGLEAFYETAGLPICVGYGLTECSPLLTFRRSDANLITAGCAGMPCTDTEVRIVDPDSKASAEKGPRRSLPDGEAGVILGRGPQVTKGYYKNDEATRKAIDEFGWFDTGDLGRINPATGDLILTGRAKDTIVLSNGENIEPTPIEDAILGLSPLVDQIMVAGQDGRRLVAVAVLNPSEIGISGYLDESTAKKLQEANEKVNDPKCTDKDCKDYNLILNDAADKLRKNAELKTKLMADMKAATKSFRPWEQVGDVYMTLEPFAMANGLLTQSYKVKRASVQERYQDVLSK